MAGRQKCLTGALFLASPDAASMIEAVSIAARAMQAAEENVHRKLDPIWMSSTQLVGRLSRTHSSAIDYNKSNSILTHSQVRFRLNLMPMP